jgi:hypothetical protein
VSRVIVDRRVTETLRDDLRVDSRGERERRRGVTEVVQPDPGYAGGGNRDTEEMADAIRVDRRAILPYEHVSRLDPDVLGVAAFALLTLPMLRQRRDGARVERDDAP